MLDTQPIQAFRHARWSLLQPVPAFILPAPWRAWVLAPGSLTQRLIQASAGDFRVQVLQHHWSQPWASERKALGLRSGEQALVREVALLCHGQPWVMARTLIPATTLQGPQRRLGHLGNTPLGAYLFRCRNMRRAPLEIASAVQTQQIWGRRSVFYVNERPLLVSEFFLPAILQPQTPAVVAPEANC